MSRPYHETLRSRVLTAAYRKVPPLKYWGLRRGYLKRIGWIRSNWDGACVDAAGAPLPWYTYPFIDFLAGRVRPTMKVFEYGSGQSTRWWAAHASSVHAVEDDRGWFERVRTDVPANVDLRFADATGGAYAASIADRGSTFDVVVIDGSTRNDCARACLGALAPDGVVIWDNTEEPNIFGPGLALLEAEGFHRIDFHGLTPLNMDPSATSILYRPAQNCFGL